MQVHFTLNDPRAVVPTKGTPFSVGYDLTAISVYKKLSDKTTLYDTGVSVEPPPGYYTEILPRSSMSKTGYCLSNSVGVIDRDFTGNLLIALTRIDDSFPELTLPFTRCQLVLRKHEDFSMIPVASLSETVRGGGGFGSTDLRPGMVGSGTTDKPFVAQGTTLRPSV
jgi:dUTP pyrophosphatase